MLADLTDELDAMLHMDRPGATGGGSNGGGAGGSAADGNSAATSQA